MVLSMNVIDLPTGTTPESATTSLTTQIYEKLRDDILRSTLAPGKKLRIEEIKETYGVGASAIREALSLLTSESLVERVDHRGFRVSPVSRADFDELLTTRIWLEERALRESIQKGQVAWEEAIVLAHFHLSRTSISLEPDRLLKQDDWETRHKIFHRSLIDACGSKLLLRFCDQMYDLNIRYRRVASPPRDEERNIHAEHAAIVEAVLARSEDLAVQLLMDHYRQTAVFIRERLD
jgi:DNA-binding GntR family transcriptional regulator